MAAEMLAPCARCLRETRHKILHAVAVENYSYDDEYYFLECAGCGSVSMANICAGTEKKFYPSPVTRPKPKWLPEIRLSDVFQDRKDISLLGDLLTEIYEAVEGGQRRLALMGIRALLEDVMISSVRDQGTFEANLDRFCADGFASTLQRRQLGNILEAGHAAIHRSYVPSEHDLNLALDIAEGIMATIYDHPERTEKLAGAVPKRQPKSPQT